MSVSLKPVTDAEHAAVVALVPNPGQQQFIATNAESLAEAAENPACRPMLITVDGIPIGFAMSALDPEDGNQWIYRFMIDHRHQGKGYGATALDHLTSHIFSETGCPRIMISVKPANTTAIRLYKRAGFRPAGFEFDGETAFCLDRPTEPSLSAQ